MNNYFNTLLFDWGNTLMIDYVDEKGPMFTWSKVKTVKHAQKTLKKLSKKYRCCIATNAKDSSKEEIIKALKRGRINKYISEIYCYKAIGYEKSSKEYFERIISNNNKEKYLMIGDVLESDIAGANNFGLNAILFDPTNRYPEYNGTKINDLIQLLAILL
jgi:FMN phosphatase YigB (HAD superfamily)